MVLYRKDHNKFQVNFSAFNSTYEVETPTCSARDLELHYLNQKQVQEKKFSLMMVQLACVCTHDLLTKVGIISLMFNYVL